MPAWSSEIIRSARDRWHTKSGLIIALVVVLGSALSLFARIDLDAVSPVEWLIISICAMVTFLVWWKTRLPRTRRGHVGFGISLSGDGSKEAEQLCGDFVLALRETVSSRSFTPRLQFVEFPQRAAARVGSLADADALLRAANLHYLLFGRIRVRNMPGGRSHVIDLHGLVRHARVDQQARDRLKKEFTAALPQRLIVGVSEPLITFEFSARHIGMVSKYVIGMAAGISGDLIYAEQLLRDAEADLRRFQVESRGLAPPALLHGIRARLREVYEVWLWRLSVAYQIKRTRETLIETESIIGKLREYDPSNYRARLSAAICAFVLRRDIDSAIREIDACAEQPDSTWLYSRAFLQAYGGDLETAYRSYSKAFDMPLADATVPIQCEEFIQGVLEEEPERKHLYYCLGLINYRAKEDLKAAHRDFVHFRDKVDQIKFRKAIESTDKWLSHIEAVINASAK